MIFLNIRIVTDSACDIPLNAELNNVDIMNFHININDRDCEERVDFTIEEFENSMTLYYFKSDGSIYSWCTG